MPSGGVCGVLSIMPRICEAACSAIARACAGVSATSPLGTATPNSRSSALAWYSWTFIRARSHHQRDGLQLTADRVQREPERLERRRPEQRGIAVFAEDHVGDADVLAELEKRAALVPDDRRAVRQAKALARERRDLQPAQDGGRNDGIEGAGVDHELEALSYLGSGEVRDVDVERRDSDGDRPPR